MKLVNRAIFLFLVGTLTFPGFAQTKVCYYRSYEDFIRGMDVPPSSVVGRAFYRASVERKRVMQLDYILPDGTLSSFTKYFYNADGSLVVKDTYTADSLLRVRTSYQADEIQSLMLQKIYGRDWVPLQKDYYTVCHFDSLGNPVKYEIKAASGEAVGRLEYRYNDRNDMIMEIWIRARDNKVLELSDFTFDYKNNIRYITQYDSSGLEVSRVSLELPVSVTDSTHQR